MVRRRSIPHDIHKRVSYTAALIFSGAMFTYLTKLPLVSSVYDSTIAYLSGLKEITITDQHQPDSASAKLEIESEPTVMALGPYHIMMAHDKAASWFILSNKKGRSSSTTPQKPDSNGVVLKKEYPTTIAAASLNATLAAVLLADGRLMVHSVDTVDPSSGKALQKLFPAKDMVAKHSSQGKVLLTIF
jgi:hypothetical protein